MLEPQILMTGLAFGESPRWHDGRLWLSDWGAYEALAVDAAGHSNAIFALHDPDELSGLLRGAGFHDMSVETTTKTLRRPPPADFLWQYIHATPMAAAVAEAGDDRREKLQSDVLARWQDFVDGGGLVYDQPW